MFFFVISAKIFNLNFGCGKYWLPFSNKGSPKISIFCGFSKFSSDVLHHNTNNFNTRLCLLPKLISKMFFVFHA